MSARTDITSQEARLYAHMHVAESGCWEWIGARNRGGYGVLGRGCRSEGNVLAHRLAWELWRGPIPVDRYVLHRCDNRPCFNPEHLFLGTYADNNRDMARKGRHFSKTQPERVPRGERHGSAKLTDQDVREIRAARKSGQTFTEIALRFHISHSTASRVARGIRWAHVQ